MNKKPFELLIQINNIDYTLYFSVTKTKTVVKTYLQTFRMRRNSWECRVQQYEFHRGAYCTVQRTARISQVKVSYFID